MAAQHAHRNAALPVPDADGLVVGCRNDELSVGREGKVLDEGAVPASVEIETEIGTIRSRGP